METKNITCPSCGLNMEYWTRNNYIKCTKCGETITVEPFVDEEEIVEDNLAGIETVIIIDGVVEENEGV